MSKKFNPRRAIKNTANVTATDALDYEPDAVSAANALDAADDTSTRAASGADTDTLFSDNDAMRDNNSEAFVARMEKNLDERSLRRKKDLADGFKKNKVVNEVLDKPTVMTLYKMITGGILSGVNGAISAGKESLVFWGLDAKGIDVALKIYLVTTSNFKRRQAYVLGDPRFASVKKGTRNMVYLWAKKEFRNLRQCANAGIPVPRPIHVENNVLVMEFIGSALPNNTDSPHNAAAQLLHAAVNHDDYLQAVSIITDMYKKANLVHGDYSEYNIFKVKGRGLVVFDLGSAVHTGHPNSAAFLQRDVDNITRFFKRKGIKIDKGDAVRIMEDLVP